jgi:hypothetical protein
MTLQVFRYAANENIRKNIFPLKSLKTAFQSHSNVYESSEITKKAKIRSIFLYAAAINNA